MVDRFCCGFLFSSVGVDRPAILEPRTCLPSPVSRNVVPGKADPTHETRMATDLSLLPFVDTDLSFDLMDRACRPAKPLRRNESFLADQSARGKRDPAVDLKSCARRHARISRIDTLFRVAAFDTAG